MYYPDSAYSQNGHLGGEGEGGVFSNSSVCSKLVPLVRDVEDRIVSVC